VEHVAHTVQMQNSLSVLVRKPEGQRALGRPRRIRDDNIRMDRREIGYEVGACIHLAQGRD